jgi:hypothetical protein
MVEIWFGILTLKSLRGASFSSTQELGAQIKAFQKAYNKTAQPFVLKKREIMYQTEYWPPGERPGAPPKA